MAASVWRGRITFGLVSIPVLLVKAADALHNTRSILTDYRHQGEQLWARFTGSKSETLWYVTALATTLKARLPESRNVQELERVVAELKRAVSRTA